MAKRVFARAGGDPCQDKGGADCSFPVLITIGYGYCTAGGDPASNTEPDQDQFCSYWTKEEEDFGDCQACADAMLEFFGAIESGLPSVCDSSELL